MEAINGRGVGVDLAMISHAAKLAAEDKVRSAAEIRNLTGARVGTVDEVAKMTAWLLEVLPPGGREILLKREEETDENGEIVKPSKFALRRAQVQRLLAFIQTLDRNNPDYLKAERVLNDTSLGWQQNAGQIRQIYSQTSTAFCTGNTSSTAPRRPAGPPRKASRSITWPGTPSRTSLAP